MRLHLFCTVASLRACVFTISFLLLFDVAWGQQIAFPDANLRAEIFNEYGVTAKGANNAAVPVAGTNKIDFTNLNASNPDPLTHGVNGVTQLFKELPGQINDLTGLEQLPKLAFLDMQGNSGLLFPAGFTNMQIQYLDICSNNLSTLPANFSNLTSLNSLMICFNKFTNLPLLPVNLISLEVENNNLTDLSTLPNGLKSVDASSNSLAILPDLPLSLIALFVQNNKLTALPTLPAGLVNLNIADNNLTFEDIEPIMSLFDFAKDGTYNYGNQANFSITPATKNVMSGQPLNLTATGFIAGSVNNRYQWFKNGTAVSQVSASPAFSIANAAQTDAGSYVCAVTNTVVTGLTISSNPVVVSVGAQQQIISFPDANLRAAILNQYGGTTQGVNNYYGAVPVAGTINIDFTGLHSSFDPAAGINGVTELSLDFLPAQVNDFSGIEQLPSLVLLDIQGYSSFQVPASFVSMPLKFLTLSNDNLTSLPNNFTNIGTLNALNLSHNNFASLPSIPASVTDLDMGYNSLTSLSSLSIGLTSLGVNNNSLTSLPTLPLGLTLLKANDNSLTGLPSIPTGLHYLYVSNNNLTTLPSLPNVQILDAQNNNLNSLPVLSANIDALKVDHNNISSLPSLPADLYTLSASHNQLTSLPAFPIGLHDIDISYNSLTFEDLEPVISYFGPANSYDHQATFSITPVTKNITTGQALNLTAAGFIAGSVNNRYQWFKDGVAVSQVTASPAFSIAGIAQSDAGSYVCAVTNTVVTGLTISSDPVNIFITSINTGVIDLAGDLQFGDQLAGVDHPVKSFTITNTGTGMLTVNNITLPAGYTLDKSNGTIGAGQSMVVAVTFTPTTSQDYSGTIQVVSDATSGVGTIQVSGRGLLIAGIGDENSSEKMQVYPNPSEGVFTLHIKDNDGKVILTDETGRTYIVHPVSLGGDNYKLDISDKADGVYILTCEHGKGAVALRVIKN